MIYEYINYDGGDILTSLKLVECKFFICTGDLTTWYQFPMKIGYKIYSFTAIIGWIFSLIDYTNRKEKITRIVFITWTALFLINFVPLIVLEGQNYGLSLMIYYEIFITMQFFALKHIVIFVLYLIFIYIFISYTYDYLKMLRKKFFKGI